MTLLCRTHRPRPGSAPVNITSGSALLKQAGNLSARVSTARRGELFTVYKPRDVIRPRCDSGFKPLVQECCVCLRLDVIRLCQYEIYWI